MTSSVFIESSSLPSDVADHSGTSDSNLVVVYGKNSISFDEKGLENFIEEKKISSISVIRLTSPTPSMEQEEVKSDEKLRRHERFSADSCGEEGSANVSDASGSGNGSSDCREDQTSERYDRILHEEDVEQTNTRQRTTLRQRRLQSNPGRQTRSTRKRKTVKPEVVGLRLEEFYPPEEANVIIKEALKMAGLGPNRKSKEDFEFQLMVIKNDHCYTPFTSPTQMKAKLAADKLDLEMQGTSRKAIGAHQGGVGGKQVFVRRKLVHKDQNTAVKPTSVHTTAKEKVSSTLTSKLKKFGTEAMSHFDSDRDGSAMRMSKDDCEDVEGSENGPSEEGSGESDNDRDSDLDFDVNNPKGRRRKIKLAKAIKRHNVGTLRANQKMKRLHSQEDTGDMIKKSISAAPSRQKCMLKSPGDIGRIVARSAPSKSNQGLSVTSTQAKTVPSPVAAAAPLISRISNEKYNTSTSLLPSESSTSIKNVPKTSAIKGSAVFNTPMQTHREVLINKQIMSSPKTKGFTELSALIDQGKKEETNYQVECGTPVKSTPADGFASQKSLLQCKGFTPIGLEMVAKNQLPAQISIQTHQSSSELEAENDKQLDLINSIVQNELKKSNEIVTPAANINENIPKLVKMLESTEKVLEGNSISKTEDNKSSKINDSHGCANENIYGNHVPQSNHNAISVIDINNASLLVTPDGDDDLPDDILQLVDMIPDDKTLQEAVKELDADNCNESASVISHKPPPLALITPQYSSKNQNKLEDIANSSKSIIQASISNLPVSSMTPTTPVTSRTIPSKPSTVLRSEPIQIIRGNGRVITLPPIEAPTTRAKRRAQVQPHSILQKDVTSPVASVSVSTIMTEASRETSMPPNFAATSGTSLGQEKQPLDNSRRRSSKDILTVGSSIGQKPKGRSTSRKVKSKLQSDVGATESANEDDDDPNKLWCICRQPHNNRFMICCDACEDWFHGTCVNITKAMGLEMEQKGIDWTCPKCIKRQEEKKQPKISEMMLKRPQNPSTSTVEASVIGTPVGNVSLLNIQTTNFPNKQASEVTQTVIDTSKTRMQPGQFINLKDLSSGGKKVLIQAASNSNFGQKKIFLTTQPLKNTSTTLTTPIRTIAVVKHIPGHVNQMSPHQSIKVIRTIAPAKSTAQSFITTASSDSASKLAGTNEKSTGCIVCKKNARLNSIYCSDDCIRKHAQNALQTIMNKTNTEVDSSLVSNTIDEKAKKKTKGLFEDLLSMADRKPKVERINVYERKSGRILTGSSAPTIANLKKWLQENPTFEVVQPGSSQALDLEKKHKLRGQHSPSPTAHPKATSSPPPLKLLPMTSPGQQKNDSIRSNSPQTPASVTLFKQTLTPQLKSNQKSILDFGKGSSPSNTSRPGTPKQQQKFHVVSIKSDRPQKATEDTKSIKEKSHSSKKQTASEISNSKPSSNDGEPIRLLVRRTLKEQLLLRTHEEHNSESDGNSTHLSDFPKLTPEAIEEFANLTELEMYNYFNRDAGMKYKAKYRSLIFNIKDRKNHTLFAKICRNQIEPKQLVRMTPDEMASQELAQWRKQENKHQLEMIKKSELDLLACAKNYVLKTHKGEEVIETKSTEYENVDLSIPVEDVVAALNKTNFAQEPSTTPKPQSLWSDVDSTVLTMPHASEQTPLLVEEKLKSSKDKDKDRHRERDQNLEDRERDKRHKSKDSYRDRSRSRKRSRSHSRSRSCERYEKRHKSSHKDEKRDREKDRAKERADQPSEGKSNDKKIEKKPGNVTRSRESFSSKKQHIHHESCANSLETYNLIDQILESTKTVEEAANIVPDKEKTMEGIRKSSGTPLPSHSISSTTAKDSAENYVIDIPSSPNNADSDQEPTSTVSIPTPPHDPYARFMHPNSPSFDGTTNRGNANTLWIGDINMVDVASFQLSIQPVLGNCVGLGKLLAKELDVVGRIGPETVWDYISKIKKSPNKEILIIRLVPSSESETSAYKILYEYLDKRKRLGVVKSVSPYIKDFYVFPLGAGKQMPTVLQHNEPVEFYDDPYRPDMLMGILIRVVVAKRHSLVVPTNTGGAVTSIIAGNNKVGSRSSEAGDSLQSPPGSPKLKKRRQSIAPKDIDVDAIIKAPIVSKSQKGISNTASTVHALMDADEPYSPGGSSDDDLPLLPVKLPANSNQIQTAEDELKRKMEEINRQIAAQEMEIAGLLTGETSKFGPNSSKTAKVLANIAIPSNLSQILASIKQPGISQESFSGHPPPPPLIGSLIKNAGPSTSVVAPETYNAERVNSTFEVKNTSSRLANLSEAELLSMVPDHIAITPKPPPVTRYKEPPPPGV